MSGNLIGYLQANHDVSRRLTKTSQFCDVIQHIVQYNSVMERLTIVSIKTLHFPVV